MASKKVARPPKSWWRSCVSKVFSRGMILPAAERVCGDVWYRRMSPASRRRAKRRHPD